MICIDAEQLQDGLYNIKDGKIYKYKANGGTVRAYKIENRPQGEVDAIDRDALIDYCLKLIDVERKQGSDVMNYGQERVNQTEAIIDYIEHMPHVNADRPQEWIPCSEKLPEADGLYLATFTLIGIPKFSNVESFKNGKWEYHNGYIIAWMPLPEPWKGADDE